MVAQEFTRLEYRRTIAWPRRIAREWPFLQSRLEATPERGYVADLGCGSGEHVRYLAAKGYPALGIDRSRDALALAIEGTRKERDALAFEPLWIRADITAVPLAAETCRLALLLGNTIPILETDDAIAACFRECRRVLLPGGLLVAQVLNYHRLRRRNERYLPLNFRPVEDRPESEAELVYLRVLDFAEPEHVGFHVITLERCRGADEVAVRHAVLRRLRSIEFDRLRSLLVDAGFSRVELYGDFSESPFEPVESPDVIVVAGR